MLWGFVRMPCISASAIWLAAAVVEAAAGPSGWTVLMNGVVVVLVGAIAFLLKRSIAAYDSQLADHGRRLRKVELGVVRMASKYGIHLDDDDDTTPLADDE